MIRKIIFWSHLISGLIAGLVILSLSVTGVLLTYERQIKNWLAEADYVSSQEQEERLGLDALLLRQRQSHPEIEASTVILSRDTGAPVQFRAGRRGGVSLNPYSAAEMEVGSPAVENFFRTMTGFHRWFSLEGENRNLARDIVGISNLAFLFLVISGIYLWLPRLWKWPLFKARLLFAKNPPNSKARDFNWHHVMGFWALIPLIAIVYTGAMFHYPWASDLLYAGFGVERPTAPGAGGHGPGPAAAPGGASVPLPAENPTIDLSGLALEAQNLAGDDWERMNINLPRPGQEEIRIEVDWGNGAQAHAKETYIFDIASKQLLGKEGYSDLAGAQKIRGIGRFLHTGELLGFWGQTIAGLASLAAVFMVWTGFALAYRRLLQPLFRRKR